MAGVSAITQRKERAAPMEAMVDRDSRSGDGKGRSGIGKTTRGMRKLTRGVPRHALDGRLARVQRDHIVD